MTQWHSKELGDGVDALAPQRAILDAFIQLVKAGSQLAGIAVFSSYDTHRNVVTVYFTPNATAIAQAFGALPCERPSREHRLGLLAGDQKCWILLEPE